MSAKKSKVLVVDDSSTQRLAWVVEFTRCAHVAPVTARNGQEALELAKKDPPDVIVTDLDMPVMDGATFVREIKAVLPEVFVMIVSGSIQPGLREAMARYKNVFLFSKTERATAMHSAFLRIGIGCTHQATCVAGACPGAKGKITPAA